ncbi:MAG: hypothetical protein WCJ94_00400, partial [bacterium]
MLKKVKKNKSLSNKSIRKNQKVKLEVFEDTNLTINNVDKYKIKLEMLENEVQILREIAEITRKDFSFKKTLERFLVLLMKTVNAEAGTLYLFDKATDKLVLAVERGV